MEYSKRGIFFMILYGSVPNGVWREGYTEGRWRKRKKRGERSCERAQGGAVDNFTVIISPGSEEGKEISRRV